MDDAKQIVLDALSIFWEWVWMPVIMLAGGGILVVTEMWLLYNFGWWGLLWLGLIALLGVFVNALFVARRRHLLRERTGGMC